MITIRFLRVRFNKVVCVYKSALNCCVRFQRVKSNYLMTIFCLGASLSCAKYLSLFKRGGHNNNKKNTDEKEKKKAKNRMGVALFHFFFLRQNLFFCCSFGCFREEE